MPKFPPQRSRRKEPAPAEPVPREKPTGRLALQKLTPKNERQQEMLDAVRNHDLTFVIGPAGTGKTHLVIHAGITALLENRVRRLILSRPAIEVKGEKLGFLPGDFNEKLDPYMRPMVDAIVDQVGLEGYQRLTANGLIEVVPLAFMRGRNLKNAFIALDEFQNATPMQLKTALTRIGEGSICVATADPEQIDLPNPAESSINDLERFGRSKDIAIVRFGDKDVIRSRIVRTVLACYKDTKADDVA